MIIAFLLFLSFNASSFVPPESFDSTYIELEDSIFSTTIKGHKLNAKGVLSSDVIDSILSDKKNLIREQFEVPPYFKESVRFWFSIYTQYSSKEVVIHDKENLKIVYNILDFNELHDNTDVHRFSKSKIQSYLSLEYTRKVKKILLKLSSANFKKLNQDSYNILKIIKAAGIHIPKNLKKRKKTFLKLANNIRTQTGLRNRIFKGVIRSIPYWPFLKKQVQNFRLPEELLAIAFLESSFNPLATSKAAATGVWQIMPFIGNILMPKATSLIDYRNSPIISSIAAFHLLKENRVNLKRWDLAITAYNSGTKHLKKAIKKFSKKKKRKDITLEYILENYKHPHIGFASSNFYAGFLALVHVLAYKESIYPLSGLAPLPSFRNPADLSIYISKCAFTPKKFFRLLKSSSPKIVEINSQFKSPKKALKRGTLIASDIKLTSRKYYRLSDKQLRSVFPHKYFKFMKNKKCR